MCGDFNTVADLALDKRSQATTNSRKAPTRSLQRFMTQTNLIDVYRLLHPEGKTHTWQSQGHNVAERIDMILVSNSFKHRASDIQTTPTIYSDHSSVSCLLQTEHEHKRGRGMWKFNVNHLKDSAYTQQIEWLWQHWRTQKQRFETQREWWDIGKILASEVWHQQSKTKPTAMDQTGENASPNAKTNPGRRHRKSNKEQIVSSSDTLEDPRQRTTERTTNKSKNSVD